MRKKSNKANGIYLIKRGAKPEHHNAPFHPVIICTRQHTAKWEAGDSNDGATVWTNSTTDVGGFLMGRYKGFDVDYGAVVKSIKLFDTEETAGFYHQGTEPWDLLKGAVWWSDQEMPQWIKEAGAVYPPDNFTKWRIWDDSGTCLMQQSKADKLDALREELFEDEPPFWLTQNDDEQKY